MSNQIRKLAIGAEVKERFIYMVDSPNPVYKETVNGVEKKYYVCNIVECETKYRLYVKCGDEIHYWKDEMKNEFCHPEYFLN